MPALGAGATLTASRPARNKTRSEARLAHGTEESCSQQERNRAIATRAELAGRRSANVFATVTIDGVLKIYSGIKAFPRFHIAITCDSGDTGQRYTACPKPISAGCMRMEDQAPHDLIPRWRAMVKRDWTMVRTWLSRELQHMESS